MPPDLEVRRADDRFVSRRHGCTAWHSFSFGEHYDPGDVGHGPLVAVNDERCQPGSGYALHTHRGVELVTWVVEGVLRHQHAGAIQVLDAGCIQVLTVPGRGEHAETNAGFQPVRFVQLWLRLDGDSAGQVEHQVRTTKVDGAGAVLTVVAASDSAGREDLPLKLRAPGVTVTVAAVPAEESIELPPAAYAHVLVTRGSVRIGCYDVGNGDAVRVSHREPSRAEPLMVAATEAAELLVCALAE